MKNIVLFFQTFLLISKNYQVISQINILYRYSKNQKLKIYKKLKKSQNIFKM